MPSLRRLRCGGQTRRVEREAEGNTMNKKNWKGTFIIRGIPPDFWKRAKTAAQFDGRSLNSLTLDALRRRVASIERRQEREAKP